MSKVQGQIEAFAYIRDEGSRTVISYEREDISEQEAYWQEVTIPKTKRMKPSLQEVKQAVIADIDAQTKTAIIGGFKWQDKPVWLSIENQLNFSQATAPVTLKIGEQEDGTPVYHDFASQQDITDFCTACTQWTQQQREAGWARKDGIDWQPYEALFPVTEK